MEAPCFSVKRRSIFTFCPPSLLFQRHQMQLALPSAEAQQITSGKAGVETWEYKAKNSLMYYPPGEGLRGSLPNPWQILPSWASQHLLCCPLQDI